MNNLQKIKTLFIISFLVLFRIHLFADQGVLKEITPDSTFANIATISSDIALRGDIYAISQTNYIRYDKDGNI